MDANEINWGPALEDPVTSLVGMIRLYGLTNVVTFLYRAVDVVRESAMEEACQQK